VIERMDRLIAREDTDVSEAIREILEAEGIVVRTGTDCIGFRPHEHGVQVSVDCSQGDASVIGSHLLIAAGPIRMISVSTRQALPPIPAATSKSTTSCARMSQASGR
jgi:pyruvate/2-oxoglutarate dehydrogenase complex dihydrolipoamide dehydrogenase (E3) component